MGKSSPSPPPPVDTAALTQQQIEANRVTEFTPLGTRRFGEIGPGGEFVPGTGGTAARIELTPVGQEAFDLEQEITRILGGRALEQTGFLPAAPVSFAGLPEFRSEFDFSGLTPIPGVGDFSADARRLEGATFQRALGLLNPEFIREEERLEQRLANQGLPIGSEAFEGEFDRFDRVKDEARLAAALEAVGAGRTEQSRLFGLSQAARGQQLTEQLQDIGLGRSGRQQGIAELTGQRAGVFNELASLLGLTQVQTPQFAPPTPIDVLTPAAMQQAGLLAQFNAQNARQSDLLGGLTGLGSSALMAAILAGSGGAAAPAVFMPMGLGSSRDFKTDNEPIDEDAILAKVEGLPIESWCYKSELGLGNDTHIGTYAEDFRDAFGIGDGRTLDVATTIGVLMASVQALSRKVRQLEQDGRNG